MVTGSQKQKKDSFPNWKIHSRAGNFNRRWDSDNDIPFIWKTWGNSITENTKYLETFVKREAIKEYDLFYYVWKYPMINSRVSLDKVYLNTKSKWLIREYLLIPFLNRFAINPTYDFSTLWKIQAFDETSRLNLYNYQTKFNMVRVPRDWTKCFERARLSLSRRSSIDSKYNLLNWFTSYRRVKKGFIGNKNGAWDTRFNFLQKSI
ncbi:MULTISPECIES: hypothetical protein [Leptospira]|uniref:hypothetical protein n=1 Tax=Leptospira TaxID=171 RepID=UPI001090B988|nr:MULTISPECIES: hypothetical protein [Leptospira]TGL99657.1 hypothetical protein EHQ79_17940 [Leptospira jelokensis]TGM80515.1 hypothetical protein EHQ99_12660 [Leptospira bouyouniensis]